MRISVVTIFLFSILYPLYGLEIKIIETASINQVYGDSVQSESLLPMNELNVSLGYVEYQTNVEIFSEKAILEIENIRDYAVVYIGGELQGTVTDERKKMILKVPPGKYTLKIYAENIGRITYGPEILDNSKGLFGNVTVDGDDVENWTMTELKIRICDVKDLKFENSKKADLPSFHRGNFTLNKSKDVYLDISGWGMGEAWINGQYLGSFWEEEKQQSIRIPKSLLQKGKNEIVIFELKNNNQESVKLSKEPIFK